MVFGAIFVGSVVAATGQVQAGPVAHGFSNYDGNETLTLRYSSGPVEIISTNGSQGWWNTTNGHNASITNYIVGDINGNGSNMYNDFFTFNVSSAIGKTLTGATLSLTQFGNNGDSTFTLFDVSTDAAMLNATSGPNAAIFADLCSGNSYGSFSEGVGTSKNVGVYALNGQSLIDINNASNAGRLFSIGGTLNPEMTAVPEPSTIAAAIFGLITGAMVLYRRRNVRIAA